MFCCDCNAEKKEDCLHRQISIRDDEIINLKEEKKELGIRLQGVSKKLSNALEDNDLFVEMRDSADREANELSIKLLATEKVLADIVLEIDMGANDKLIGIRRDIELLFPMIRRAINK